MDINVYWIIFGEFYVDEVLDFRLVCKEWKNAIDKNKVFTRLCRRCPIKDKNGPSYYCSYHCDNHTCLCEGCDQYHCKIERCKNYVKMIIQRCNRCNKKLECEQIAWKCDCCKRYYCEEDFIRHSFTDCYSDF